MVDQINFDDLDVGVFRMKKNGAAVYVNRYIREILKNDKKTGETYDLSATLFRDLDLKDIISMIVAEGNARGAEFVFKDDEGKENHYLLNAHLDGAQICGTVTSISGLKNEQDGLQSDLSLCQATFESTFDGILVTDLEDHVITYNSRFCKVWGLVDDAGKPIKDLSEVASLMRKIKNSKAHIKDNKKFYDNPGMVSLDTIELEDDKIYERYTQPLYQGDKIVGRVWSFRDITDFRRALEGVSQSEQQLRLLVDSSPDCICHISLSGEFLRMNNAGSRMNRLDDPNELIGTSAFNGVVENLLGVKDAIKRASVGETVTLRYKSKNKIDEEIWWDSMVGPIKDEAGNIKSLLRVSRNVTERLIAEEELQKIQRIESIGLLAGGIAHDFNNILTAILGNLSLASIARDKDNHADLDKSLQSAKNAVIKARDLTQQLLTFSKGGAPIRTAASMQDLIEENAMFVTRGTGIKCELRVQKDLWSAVIDKSQISQVINNIIVNAVQASKVPGTIVITAENITVRDDSRLPKTKKFIKIEVKDEGSGMTKEILRKIFDPYFTTKKHGNGLGLSTSFSIIQKHDGLLKVESEPGKGSNFKIYLPASETFPDADVPARSMNGKGVAGKYRVLVMDDEAPIRELLTAALENMGCEVVVSEDGQEALDLFKLANRMGDPFDLIITDLTVPGGFGGKELVEKISKMKPDAKVIVSSGFSVDPIMADHKAYGFAGVLPKPFLLEDLEELVQQILSN